MFEDVMFVVKDYFVWLRRRTYLLIFTFSAICFVIPIMFIKAIFDYLRGKNWFSDPIENRRLFQYGRELVKFGYGTLVLRTKQATEEAFVAAKNAPVRGSGDGVTVVLTEDYLEFQPPPPPQDPTDAKDGRPLVGVIIIPGALVSPFAYSILARDLARRGHPCFILRLPFDLAFYGWGAAGRIIKRPHKEGRAEAPTKWVLAGHSLGGSGVELFTDARPECVNGVVLMGCRNISGKLAKYEIPSLVLWGSRDSLTLGNDIEKAKDKMPKGTETFMIEGGNHRGFASYTHQALDWEATITPDEQRRIIVEALTDFIGRRIVA